MHLVPQRPSATPVQAALSDEGTLVERFRAVRALTGALCGPLSPEDMVVQSMPDASPAKWHLAHTTWFFETFLLASREPGFSPFHPRYQYLFNSYYDAVGPRHARARRGLLTRPSLEEIRAYRAQVDARVEALLARRLDGAARAVLELGLNHEWTRSAYGPYPRFRAAAGALGEYNGKFMCNQLVLRGGSCATPAGHVRTTYRNFFYPDARWQFSGIRLAREA